MKPETGNRKPETGDLLHWGFEKKSPAPQGRSRSLEDKIHEMTAVLNRTRILHSDQLLTIFGWRPRTCRAVAEASKGRIISFDGGYVLNERASNSEFAQANGRIRSQGEKMINRAQLEKEVREELVGS